MRYYYSPPDIYLPLYGEEYRVDHPMFSKGTLYLIHDRGLIVVQKRFNVETKTESWGPLDPWLANDIYLHPQFYRYFQEHSGDCTNGLYPVTTVRSIMWALKMKPLKHEFWEDWKGD